jgi:putative GTP pyrophosphokinase
VIANSASTCQLVNQQRPYATPGDTRLTNTYFLISLIMESNSAKILAEYRSNKVLYDECSIKIESLIIDLIKANNINVHQISKRVKEEISLEGKLIKKLGKYKSISDVTDIIGVRVIAYFEDEVDKIADVIEREFDIDKINSIDKRELDDDRFGYRSLHYVFSIKKNRTRLVEYKKFAGLKAELQIRTILQHSWAEIEHDIGYKSDIGIPKLAKRTFYRVAALLETADQEFVKLKNTLREYENTVVESIQDSPGTVLIDKASLESYINNSHLIARLDKQFCEYAKVPTVGTGGQTANSVINRLGKIDVQSIKDLDDFIKKNEIKLFNMFKKDIDASGIDFDGLSKGIVLFHLDRVKA